MSVGVLKCSRCHNECAFDGLGSFPPHQQASYGVAWKCIACGARTLDVCNLGPLAPTRTSCLNCGSDYQSELEECPGCGLTRAEAEAFLRVPATVGRDAIALAQQAFQKGLFQHGLAVLNRLLQEDMGIVDAWLLKHRFYESLGFWRAAQEMYEQALARGAPPSLLLHYGSVLAAQGADVQAAAAFQRFLDIPPQDPKTFAIACSEQGNALTRLGHYNAAEKAHQRAIAASSTLALLYLNYADTFIKQKRWDAALRTLDIGLDNAKTSEETGSLLEAKAHVLAGLLRGEEALACIESAMTRGANSAKTHYIRGRALAMLGRLEEAKEAMKRVLMLDPGNRDAQQAIETIDGALP